MRNNRKQSETIRIDVITHYNVADPNFRSDHYGIDVCVNGDAVLDLEDESRCEASAQAEGFIKAFEYLFVPGCVVVRRINKADRGHPSDLEW